MVGPPLFPKWVCVAFMLLVRKLTYTRRTDIGRSCRVQYEGKKKKNSIGQSSRPLIKPPLQLTQVFRVCESKELVYKTLVWNCSPSSTVVWWFIDQRFN
jgi:hypothetical protein